MIISSVEVTPFVSDAWVDENYIDQYDRQVGRVGYEINFNRYFYRYVPPRPLDEINTDLRALEVEIEKLMKEVVGMTVNWPEYHLKHLARVHC